MKKILLVALFCLAAGSAHAVESVWRSSHTTTADTAQALCGVGSVPRRGIFHGIRVNNNGGSGSITIYNTNGIALASSAIAVIVATGTTTGYIDYDVGVSSGLTYTTSAPNDVTFLYQCY